MESFKCSFCREDPGYIKCPACRGHKKFCKECGGIGKIPCPKCNGHGRTGEFSGTTIDDTDDHPYWRK